MDKVSVITWFGFITLSSLAACARGAPATEQEAQEEITLSVAEQRLDNAGCRELATDLCLDGVRENCPTSSTSFKPCPSPGDIGRCSFKAASVCARIAPLQSPPSN